MTAAGRAYLGDVEFIDCNDNGVSDDQDINDGTSNDCNSNGLPDECEPNLECPPDLSIELVGDAPSVLDPAGGTEVTILVEELLGTLAGAELEYEADGVSGSVSFSPIGGVQHRAAFPAFPCESEVTWRATASSVEGNDYSTTDRVPSPRSTCWSSRTTVKPTPAGPSVATPPTDSGTEAYPPAEASAVTPPPTTTAAAAAGSPTTSKATATSTEVPAR